MAILKLTDFQAKAIEYVLRLKNTLLCMKTGSGKTLVTLFAARALLKRKEVDKVVIACTKTSTSVFRAEFEEKLHKEVNVTENANEFIDFFKSKNKIVIIKHSMLETIGTNIEYIKAMKSATKDVKVLLIVDEAHNLSNDTGIKHKALRNMSVFFTRIVLATATPYSSCLTQLYGLVHLIYPKLWSSKSRFIEDHIEQQIIRDFRTQKVVRVENIRYKNLKMLREKLKEFTYFFYPPTKLNYIEHKVKLDDYTEYDNICRGIMTEEDLARLGSE